MLCRQYIMQNRQAKPKVAGICLKKHDLGGRRKSSPAALQKPVPVRRGAVKPVEDRNEHSSRHGIVRCEGRLRNTAEQPRLQDVIDTLVIPL